MWLANNIWWIVAWNLVGLIIQLAIGTNCYQDSIEFCNPFVVYKYNKSVNWFGALVLSLLYSALSPLGAAIYWFYMLCTVGRK
jgi:hypothetical protein